MDEWMHDGWMEEGWVGGGKEEGRDGSMEKCLSVCMYACMHM